MNPVLKNLLEFNIEILEDAVTHYTFRLKGLPKLKKFKDSIPFSLDGWVSTGYALEDMESIDELQSKELGDLFNLFLNNEGLVNNLKDAVRVYHKDYHESKDKIREELGLMPRINDEKYEKNLEYVFSKLEEF